MILWVFIALLIAFVVLPIVGAVLWQIIVSFFTGIFIGALGRLIVPGRQPIGLLATIVAGWIGSLGGWAIAGAIWGFKHHHGHWFATVLIEVGVAALAVLIFDLIARKHPPKPTRFEVRHRVIDI
ncbi:MAG: hypothetical protein JO214_14480 [Frankiaceae bacterium]|nr:hypothetical protein [Frankiaceae bacterium]